MRVTYLPALALGVVVTLASCGGEELPPGPPPPPSGPGFLQVLLETPRTNDGALLITLSGGPLDSLRVSQATLLTAPPGVERSAGDHSRRRARRYRAAILGARVRQRRQLPCGVRSGRNAQGLHPAIVDRLFAHDHD